jgi:hypothetical protein
MVDRGAVFPNIGAFICALFVLDYSADLFIDHTIIVARRAKVNQTLITLLTAGAEWEELAVVIAALAQRKPSLALGNVIGSCISNILGAFSLGLLFNSFPEFDKSARVYALVQLVITTFVAAGLATDGAVKLGKIGGSILVVSFAIYVFAITWSIYKGIVDPPEASDDSDEDTSTAASSYREPNVPVTSHQVATEPGSQREESIQTYEDVLTERYRHGIIYHIAQVFVGFLALSIRPIQFCSVPCVSVWAC